MVEKNMFLVVILYLHLQGRGCVQQVPPKHKHLSNNVYGLMSRETVIFYKISSGGCFVSSKTNYDRQFSVGIYYLPATDMRFYLFTNRVSSSSSSVGATARCGLWPVEQYLSICPYLSPTLFIFSLPALADLFTLLLSILSWIFLFVSSLPVLQ
jgi:hypothetical protein